MLKPSDREQEYFHKLEIERRKKIDAERQHKIKQEERERLKKEHYMHCPKCGMHLIEIDYKGLKKGLKIDECPDCKGIWLDAKELDQILELEKTSLKKLFKIFKS